MLTITAPYIELSKKSRIVSTSGYFAVIEYFGKGYFTGTRHGIKATVRHTDAPDNVLRVVEGQWDRKCQIKTPSSGAVEPFWDAATDGAEPNVRPITEQDPHESRRLWALVQHALRNEDFDTATVEKTKIEKEQRQKRKVGWTSERSLTGRTSRPPSRHGNSGTSPGSKMMFCLTNW